MLKAVFFDLDGTLLYTLEDLKEMGFTVILFSNSPKFSSSPISFLTVIYAAKRKKEDRMISNP